MIGGSGRVTLRQLRYFEAVSRHMHYGRAASECAVSQPSLSVQIQDLEQALNATLIERSRARIKLTAEGEEVARRARRILAEVKDLADATRHGARLLSGTLHFGIIPTVAPYLLPPLLPHLQETFADLKLHVRETQTATLMTELADGKLDVVLVALPIAARDIDVLRLFDDRFLLGVPPGYKIGRKLKAGPELFSAEQLLLLEEGHCLRDQALSYCQLRQVGSVNTFGASTLSTLVRMVANGHGITLIPEIAIRTEVARGEVQLLRLDDPSPQRSLGLVWRKSSPRKGDFAELGRQITSFKGKL